MFRTKEYSWISAHLPYARLRELLAGDARPKRFFSVVRDPLDRLASHLNWNLTVVAKGPSFFERHPEYDRELILDIASTDFSNPFAVVAVLQKRRSHFSNVQANCISGFTDSWTVFDDDMITGLIDESLNKFSFVSHENNIGELEKSFGFADRRQGAEIIENKSEYYFDKKVLSHEIVRDYVDELIRYDRMLYDAVIAKFGRANPPDMRRCGDGLFDAEQFNEDAYLLANKDVAAAIADGIFASGREHFERYGYAEGRRQRSCTLGCDERMTGIG